MSQQNNQQQNNGSASGAVLVFILGLSLMIGINFVPVTIISGVSKLIIVGFGLVLTLVGAILYTLSKLYIKSGSNTAFVRTGMGGQKVVIDGGIIFISLFHEKILVPLETMKLEVTREGNDALLTKDNLRADVKSEFYIKVNKNADDIKTAATSLGLKGFNPDSIKTLVFEKLVSALRTVAAQKDLLELHAERAGFAELVHTTVAKDLASNGLSLEAVTISRLDQSDYKNVNMHNVFDATGAKTVAEKTNAALVAKNQVEKNAKVSIEKQNLEATKQINELQVQQETSTALTTFEIQKTQAEQNQKAQESIIISEQNIALKKVEKEKAEESARIQKNQTIAVQNTQKVQAEETARIDKEKAILEKLTDKASADTKKAEAEANATKAQQEVLSITAKAVAEREKEVALINKESQAKQKKIEDNATADIDAYKITAKADAEQKAAEANAAAQIKKAEAEKQAAILHAEGEQAKSMVPVEVAKAQVEVKRQEVEVEGTQLRFKAQFAQVSIELETNLAAIKANETIGVAMAQSFGEALGNANLNIWGDGNTLQKMQEAFANGQSKFIQLESFKSGGGLNAGNSPRKEAEELLKAYIDGQKTAMEVMGVADNVSGEIKSLVREFVTSGGANTATGLGMMFQTLTGRQASADDIDRLNTLKQSVEQTV